jgi:hypothetical protein
MGKPSKTLMKFMADFKIDSDEVWEVRAGGAWAVKHSALERVAAEQNITFGQPTLIEGNAETKIAVMLVSAKMGDREEWTYGEASPANNKNAYCYAMAEKRAKDRVVLKLLQAHGAVYSETEADDFAPKRQNPHVTRPEDILPTTEYDEQGQPIDNIPHGDDGIETLPKAKAREDFAACQRELRTAATPLQLERWAAANKNRIATFPPDWQEMIRGIYTEHRNDLRAATKAAQ